MKLARIRLFVLILLAMLTSVLACVSGGGGGDGGDSGDSYSDAATATFGAEQFHRQLTAIAADGQASP